MSAVIFLLKTFALIMAAFVVFMSVAAGLGAEAAGGDPRLCSAPLKSCFFVIF